MKYTDFTEFIKPVHFNSYSIQSNTSHCESFRIYKLLKNVVHIILLANLAESTLFQFPIHEKEVFELNKQKRCFRFPPSSIIRCLRRHCNSSPVYSKTSTCTRVFSFSVICRCHLPVDGNCFINTSITSIKPFFH